MPVVAVAAGAVLLQCTTVLSTKSSGLLWTEVYYYNVPDFVDCAHFSSDCVRM
jgi:hypothetical protein